MKLELSQIKEITLGAARVEETENGIQFYRFTKMQENAYKTHKADLFYNRTFATSGIKLRFLTNSETLFINVNIPNSCARTYFSFDVFVNGKMFGTLDNFSEKELPANYTNEQFELGDFSKKFFLGAGEKEVLIHLPWSVKVILKDFVLDDNSSVKPVKPTKKIICFGDSITQGVDALNPSSRYPALLANFLDAEEYNKAISGEIFFPELAASKDDFEPDYITVAYGVNDWSFCTKEEFNFNCKEFFSNLHKNYPNIKTFAITPIWNKIMHEERPFGAFEEVGETIKSLTKEFDNVTVLNGFDFVPHDVNYYGDMRLHPNDKGFMFYFENLAKQIKNYL